MHNEYISSFTLSSLQKRSMKIEKAKQQPVSFFPAEDNGAQGSNDMHADLNIKYMWALFT